MGRGKDDSIMKDIFEYLASKILFVFIILIAIAIITIPFISIGIWIERKNIKTLEAEYKADLERLNKTCVLYGYGINNK